MANLAGWMKRFHIAAESAWGTTPASPTYIYVPVGSCNMQATPQSVQAQLYTGHRQRKHSRVTRYNVAGQIAMPLLAQHVSSKSIAEHFIEKAISAPAGLDLDSFLLEGFENDIDNKRWNGCRINQMTLSGDAESNVVNGTFDIIGKSETGGIAEQTLDHTQPQPLEFLMEDCTFAYAGGAIEVAGFQLVVNNNLQPRFLNSSTITYLSAGERHTSLQLTFVKSANTFDALRRATTASNATAQLILKGRHGGTGSDTFTRITIDIDRSSFINAVDNVDLNRLTDQAVDFIVLKPDTTDDDLTWTFDTAA
jgi:hypothetical protein